MMLLTKYYLKSQLGIQLMQVSIKLCWSYLMPEYLTTTLPKSGYVLYRYSTLSQVYISMYIKTCLAKGMCVLLTMSKAYLFYALQNYARILIHPNQTIFQILLQQWGTITSTLEWVKDSTCSLEGNFEGNTLWSLIHS